MPRSKLKGSKLPERESSKCSKCCGQIGHSKVGSRLRASDTNRNNSAERLPDVAPTATDRSMPWPKTAIESLRCMRGHRIISNIKLSYPSLGSATCFFGSSSSVLGHALSKKSPRRLVGRNSCHVVDVFYNLWCDLLLCNLANSIQEGVCWSRITISPTKTLRKDSSFLVCNLDSPRWKWRKLLKDRLDTIEAAQGFNDETQLVSLLVDEKILINYV